MIVVNLHIRDNSH